MRGKKLIFRTFTKAVATLLVTTAFVTNIAGCGVVTDEKKVEEINDGKTQITWWAFPVFSQDEGKSAGDYEQDLIEAFEKKNPDIHVELQMLDYTTGPEKLTNAINNASAPDVLLDAPGRIISYGKQGKLVNLSGMFTQEYKKDVNNEELLRSCMSEEQVYMYPLSSSPFYMAFNKAMLEDAGVLDLVKEGWTTDDFTKVAEALREKGYISGSVFFGDQGGDQGTRAFISNLYSGWTMSDDLSNYTVNEVKEIKGLEYIKSALNKGTIAKGQYENGSSDIASFVSGRTSFTILWGLSQQKTNQAELTQNHIETVEVPLPSDDGIPELEYLVNGFCVFDHESQLREDASKKFIAFLCDDEIAGPENVKHTGCIPVRNSFGEIYDDERMKAISKWTKYYGTYYNTVDGFANMRVYWTQMLANIANDNMSVKEATENFEKKANETLGK